MLRFLPTLMLLLAGAELARACPFCTAVLPSISQRREEAAIALLAAVSAADCQQIALDIQKILSGAPQFGDRQRLSLARAEITAGNVKAGQLALLLASRGADDAKLFWEVISLDEVAYAYIARAPARRLPAVTRLAYYAKYLEHPNPLLAEDAYLEFGHAPYDEVAQVAGELPMASMRRWMVDPNVPEARKGFYGLALGLAKTPADRSANQKLLEELIARPADDFRAGYDGMLGGYLVLAGAKGLAWVDERLITNPDAAVGDLRHALTALRFVHEFGKEAIPAADLQRAMQRFLRRPEVAAAAIVDLARWQDWDACEEIVELFDRAEFAEPATDRAIVGYLQACPLPAAADALEEFRRSAPKRVAVASQAGLLAPSSQ